MRDGDTGPTYVCRVFDGDHIMQLDQQNSGPHKTTYTCACGQSIEEFEDAGTGA